MLFDFYKQNEFNVIFSRRVRLVNHCGRNRCLRPTPGAPKRAKGVVQAETQFRNELEFPSLQFEQREKFGFGGVPSASYS